MGIAFGSRLDRVCIALRPDQAGWTSMESAASAAVERSGERYGLARPKPRRQNSSCLTLQRMSEVQTLGPKQRQKGKTRNFSCELNLFKTALLTGFKISSQILAQRLH